MLTFIKFGGSLITYKQIEASFRQDVVARLAREIHKVSIEKPDLQMLLGHGSGSFGHFEAKRYNTIAGVSSPVQWLGFSRVSLVAAELNYLVSRELMSVGLPIFRIQPSATARCEDGQLIDMSLENIHLALSYGLIPLVYGDVAFDNRRGGTIISTETITNFLVPRFPVSEVLLLGDVDGVLDQNGEVIPKITPANFDEIVPLLGSSSGIDVTGGMLTKVQDMLRLVTMKNELTVRILNGNRPDLLTNVLIANQSAGTVIKAS